jgi:hypothetical protein
MEDKSVMIKTREGRRTIFLDHYDNNEVWISIQLAGGGASTSMTLEQAKQMIAGLTTIVADMEATA